MIAQAFRDARRFRLPPRGILILLFFQLGSTAMEVAGLAALVPVLQYIQADGNVAQLVADHTWWQVLRDVYGAVGLTITLEILLATSLLLLLLRQAFVFMRLRYQAWLRETLVAESRSRGFDAYIHADAAWQDAHSAGEMVNDLTTELARAVQYLFASVALIGVGVIFLVYLATLFAISVPLTLIALCIFGVAVFAMRGQLRKTELVSKEVVEANQKMSGFLVERLNHARLVRLAGREAGESGEMHRLTGRQRSRMVRIYNLLANLEIIVEPIIIGAALVFLYVAVSVFKLELGLIGLFLVLLMRLLPVLKEAARTRQSRRGTAASFHAVADKLDAMEGAAETRTGSRPFKALSDAITFEGVSFAYETRPDKPALDNLSLMIPAGRMTALVGPSGAGKSTLFDMLPRLRRPTEGRVLFDGTDIAGFDLVSLRAGIAYAPQNPPVFNVPLIEHIRYGKSDATGAEVRAAAELANAAGFIDNLPEGIHTLAGESGNALSGGQRQRLDLARALVRGAPVLLLDEPTSNLDAESEALFREALERLRQDKSLTLIVIAHRLSTVSMADRIIVMDRGRVSAEGDHASLVAAGGWYADAFATQTAGPSAAAKPSTPRPAPATSDA